MTDCPQCARLRSEYELAELTYAKAVLRLSEREEQAYEDEYLHLREIASDARMEADLARLLLERHQRVHTSAN